MNEQNRDFSCPSGCIGPEACQWKLTRDNVYKEAQKLADEIREGETSMRATVYGPEAANEHFANRHQNIEAVHGALVAVCGIVRPQTPEN